MRKGLSMTCASSSRTSVDCAGITGKCLQPSDNTTAAFQAANLTRLFCCSAPISVYQPLPLNGTEGWPCSVRVVMLTGVRGKCFMGSTERNSWEMELNTDNGARGKSGRALGIRGCRWRREKPAESRPRCRQGWGWGWGRSRKSQTGLY